jgi:hypothetical protein
VKNPRDGPEKLVTEQILERHQGAIVVTRIISAQERPDGSSEDLLQVVEVLKIGVIHNLSNVVVNEEIVESVEVRKDRKGRQNEQWEGVGKA